MKPGAFRHLARGLDGLGLWLALGTLGGVFGLDRSFTAGLANNTAWVAHTHLVIESLNALMIGVSEASSARRGFALTGNGEQLDSYRRAIRDLIAAEQAARTLTSDNRVQQVRLDVLEARLAEHVALQGEALDNRRAYGFELDREAKETLAGLKRGDELRNLVAILVAEERRLLVARERRMAESVRRTKIVEAASAAASLSLLVAIILRLRREIRRRESSELAVRDRENAIQRLNEGLERRVQERTDELAMANGELESFGYSVIHDLRAPLRGMEGFAAVLLHDCEDTLSGDARESLGEIQQNARKMAILIDALVSMSRITRSELRWATVDLSGLAHAVADQLAAAESRPLPVLVIQENLHAHVDPPLARTLVEILLGNSWKFTGQVATGRIEFGATDLDGEHVFFVRDNGAGFDMAHGDKLFSPFGRLHTVGEFPGIGIGLASAKRIVQRHGGRIWADGHVGGGAAFYFTMNPKGLRGTT